MPVTVKVHLILHDSPICRSKRKRAGRLGVTSRQEFSALAPYVRCVKCAAILTRLPRETAVQPISWREEYITTLQ
jgi:hypothetical protein